MVKEKSTKRIGKSISKIEKECKKVKKEIRPKKVKAYGDPVVEIFE